MRDYSSRSFAFKVKVGQSMPERSVDAPSDEVGYENIRQQLAKEPPGTTFVKGTLVLHEEVRKSMADPPFVTAKAFIDHKKKNPGPVPGDMLASLQRRMQSGDA